MEFDRRTVIKGMVAGGALLGLPIPEWSVAGSTPSEREALLLLLGDSELDAAFATGVQQAASATRCGAIAAQRLRGDEVEVVSRFFAERKGTRLVGIMADGTYAVFHELARQASVRLISLGRHSCGGDASLPSRHALLSASTRHGVGSTLARCLSSAGRPFLVNETILDRGNEPSQLNGAGRSTRDSCERTDSIVDCARLLGVALACVALDVVPTAAHVSAGRGSAAQHSCVATTYATFIMDVG